MIIKMSSETASARDPDACQPKRTTSAEQSGHFGFSIADLLRCGHEAGTAALPMLSGRWRPHNLSAASIKGIAVVWSVFAKAVWRIIRKPTSAVSKPLAVTKIFIGHGAVGGLFALSTNWLHTLGSRIPRLAVSRLRSPSRSAMLADAVPKTLGRAIGFHRAMDAAGTDIRPALGDAAPSDYPLRQVFLGRDGAGSARAVAFLLFSAGQTTTSAEPPRRFCVE